MYVNKVQVGKPEFVFKAKTIQTMELIVLNSLNWRMQSFTPYSFIDYYLSKINEDENPSTICFSKSSELILSTIKGLPVALLVFILMLFLKTNEFHGGCSGNWMQVSTSWSSVLLKFLQQWLFPCQQILNHMTLIRPCLCVVIYM